MPDKKHKSLLKKLKELKEEDRIFASGWKKAEEFEKKGHCMDLYLTKIAKCVINPLRRFVNIDEYISTPSQIEELIVLAEEYYAIFEEPNE